MNKKIINFKNDSLLIYILLLLSFVISFSYPYLQYGVDGGLVLADQIKYPDKKSPMQYYFLNSWTLIHQISFLLIKIGFSVEMTSKFLIFISTISFSFGVLLFSFAITQEKFFSLLIAIASIILGKNFGDTDYPSLIFSEHTFGMLSLAFVTLSLGLIANKNFLLSCFLIVSLISVHPIIGFWMTGLCALGFFICNNFYQNRRAIINGCLIGLSLVILSFIFFYSNSIDRVEFDTNLFKIYLDRWDGHRIISKNIHYQYLIKTFILGLLSFIFLKEINEKKNSSPHILILLLGLIASSFLYLAFKFFPNLFPNLIKIAMPSRFIMLHTFLGWPLLISFLFYFLKKKFNKQRVVKIFSLLIILILLQNYKKILNISDNFIMNFKPSITSDVIEFVKKENFEEYLLTSSSLTPIIFKKTKKPILLHTESMDFIPYHPYLVDKFFNILEIIYEIKNNLPPENNNPSLSDTYVRNTFEKYSKKKWIEKKSKFDIKYIITPKDWSLNLNLVIEDQFYKLYKIL
tara:strand:- start:11829 stop:13382 length:1554 start_codon:yes stop_codon:yes gene_type:complete